MQYNNGYFDFDVEIEDVLIKGGMIDDLFYLRSLKQRKMYLNFDISQETVEGIINNILQFNCEDRDIPAEERKPILLYISSCGGEVDAGTGLIDVILASKTPVYTINLAYQYSMGFLIGLAGHKRFAMPNAKFLIHDGSNGFWNSGAKVQDEVEFQKRVADRIKKYITTHSNITSKEYDKKLRVEWYMFAQDAKEKGVTDCIIGEDCDIDEVI